MIALLRRLLGKGRWATRLGRWKHMSSQTWPTAIYAIGDVHGCLAELVALEQQIFADAKFAGGTVWVVYLGDLVDRGPQSAGVIDHLLQPAPPGITRVILGGNHEAMMLDYIGGDMDPRWLALGGAQTLQSYGVDMEAFTRKSQRQKREILASLLPQDHRTLLQNLLLTASVPGAVMVHAGLRYGVPLNKQVEDDLLWIRDTNGEQPWQIGTVVVHGHTPAPEPKLLPHRICVDTGAFATGRLTAVRLKQQAPPALLSTGNHSKQLRSC